MLTVVLVSGILLIFVGSGPFWWHIVSRVLFIPIIAGIAYEIIRIGSKKQSFFPIKLLLTCNIALQKLTTSKADDWLKKYKGCKASTPADAVENADFVLSRLCENSEI